MKMSFTSPFECKSYSFSYERFRTWTRFETEAEGNSEMAYCQWFTSVCLNQLPSILLKPPQTIKHLIYCEVNDNVQLSIVTQNNRKATVQSSYQKRQYFQFIDMRAIHDIPHYPVVRSAPSFLQFRFPFDATSPPVPRFSWSSLTAVAAFP